MKFKIEALIKPKKRNNEDCNILYKYLIMNDGITKPELSERLSIPMVKVEKIIMQLLRDNRIYTYALDRKGFAIYKRQL